MPDPQHADVHWAGELFTLSPLRVAYWARRRTLLVADMHLGKPAAFRHAGVPVPEECTAADLARLDQAIQSFAPDRLVILGDLLHARTARCPRTFQTIAAWRAEHATLDILLIRGNHDDRAGDPPEDWRFRVHDEPFADPEDGNIAFAHFPEAIERADGKHVLAGHVHPAVRLTRGARSLRAPCFLFGSRAALFPAFGSFTGTKVIAPAPADRVFIVGDCVVAVGPKPGHQPSHHSRPTSARRRYPGLRPGLG